MPPLPTVFHAARAQVLTHQICFSLATPERCANGGPSAQTAQLACTVPRVLRLQRAQLASSKIGAKISKMHKFIAGNAMASDGSDI
jgi:hypothetical protein